MKVYFLFIDTGVVCWERRGIERLRLALQHPQRLLTVERLSGALALVLVRCIASVARVPHRRTWRD